jgi:hypothetical protein
VPSGPLTGLAERRDDGLVDIQPILPVIIPVVLLQFVLLVLGLYDLTRPDRRVRGGNKFVWGLIIVLINLIGPAIYFLAGREED